MTRPRGPVLSPEQRRRQARIAANRRWHPDRPDLAEEHRELREEVATRYITDLVASWPPLTAEQRRRLAVLLAPDQEELEGGGGRA